MQKYIHGAIIKIDEEDNDLIDSYGWQCNPETHYIHRSAPGRKTIYLHREIMGCPQGLVVDHLNHNPRDNRRSNLRVCTQSENILNSRPREGKKYKGITPLNNGRFMVRFRGDYYGCWNTEEEAAQQYNRAVLAQGYHHAFLNPVSPLEEDC